MRSFLPVLLRQTNRQPQPHPAGTLTLLPRRDGVVRCRRGTEEKRMHLLQGHLVVSLLRIVDCTSFYPGRKARGSVEPSDVQVAPNHITNIAVACHGALQVRLGPWGRSPSCSARHG